MSAWDTSMVERVRASGDSEQGRAAVALLLFLAFAESHQEELGIRLTGRDSLEAISQAYGSAFFMPDDFAAHVDRVAEEMGLDPAGFGELAQLVPESTMRSCLDGLSGDLLGICADRHHALGALDELCARAAADVGFGSSVLLRRVMSLVANAEMAGETGLRVLDPACGMASLLGEVAPLAQGGGVVAGWERIPEPVVVAKIRLVMVGVEPASVRVEHANSIKPSNSPTGGFDLVVCDAPMRYLHTVFSEGLPQGSFLEGYENVVFGGTTGELFLVRCLGELAPGGCAVVALEGAFESSSKYVRLRRHLVERGVVDAVIGIQDCDYHARRSVCVLRRDVRGEGPRSVLLANYERRPQDRPEELAARIAAEVSERRPSHEGDSGTMLVSAERLLGDETTPLRLSFWVDGQDVVSRVAGSQDLVDARVAYDRASRAAREADEEFVSALKAL